MSNFTEREIMLIICIFGLVVMNIGFIVYNIVRHLEDKANAKLSSQDLFKKKHKKLYA